jgi:glycosyltransferase involved in cell wall biosynthesis
MLHAATYRQRKKHLISSKATMTHLGARPITIFTPSDAAAANSNAQNLTVKEVVARLPDKFHITMLCEGDADPRLQSRANTRLIKWTKRGNTFRLLRHCLFPSPDIYFFPRIGPLDRIFFDLRNRMKLRTALLTYVVMAMNEKTGAGMMRRCILEADTVISNSNHVAETVRHMFGVQSETIYDGIDRRYYYPPEARNRNGAATVLYAGSFQSRKRVELVIRHAARLPGVRFHLAGKGDTENQCRNLAHELGCRNVSFLGHLSPQQLGEEMRKADVFLFPSILEGNPQVLLQAAACGLPSIAMEFYHPDYVVHGKTGFLVQSDSELSAALDHLISDADLRNSFSDAAISHANQFDWDDITVQWGRMFESVAATRCAKPQQKAS